MNNDSMIIRAIDILKDVKIVKQDKNEKEYIEKSFRGQISSFGAAVEMGSLLSAVAFFSSKGGSSIDRPKLMKAIYLILNPNKKNCDEKALLQYVTDYSGDRRQLKRKVIDAAIAVKLAMNAYDLKQEKDGADNTEEKSDVNNES